MRRFLYSSSFLSLSLFICASSHSLTIKEAYELSLVNDPKIAIARERYNAGIEYKKASRSALLPQIAVYSSYNRIDKKSEGEFPITLDQDQNPLTAEIRALRPVDNESDETRHSWGVSLNQVLLDPAIWFKYQAGRYKTKQTELQYLLDQMDLIYRVLEAYLNVTHYQELLEIANSLEEAEKDLLKVSTKLAQGGMKTKIDIYRAEAALDTSTTIRLDTENKLHEAKEKLSLIIGVPVNRVSQFSDEPFQLTENIGESNEWVNRVKEQNLSVKIAQMERDHAKAISKGAASEHSIKITSSIKYSNSKSNTHEIDNTLPFDFESNTDEAMASITATLPLYSGGKISSDRRRAHSEYLESRAKLNATLLELTQNMSVAHYQEKANRRKLDAQVKALESSKKALDAIIKSYKIGASDFSELLQIQKLFFSSRKRLTESQTEYLLTLIQLKFLVSNLTTSDIDHMDRMLQPATYTLP